MVKREFVKKYISPFNDLQYIFNKTGFIVWRSGTGNNIEILHLRVFEMKKGYATKLMEQFVDKIDPFFSVFVFTRTSNDPALAAYHSWGFTFTHIKGLYQDLECSIGWVSYEELKNNLHSKSQ